MWCLGRTCGKESAAATGANQEITRQLVRSKRVLQRLHFRIAVLWIALALVSNFWCGAWRFRCFDHRLPDVDEEVPMKFFCRILCDMRIVLISFILLTDTGTFARVIFIIEVAMLLFIRCLGYMLCRHDNDIPEAVWFISQAVVSILATISVIIPGVRPEQVNTCMLWAIGLVLTIQVLEGLTWTLSVGIGQQRVANATYYMAPDLVAMLVFLRRSWQRRMLQQLRFMLEGRVVSNGAACIAALIGQCTPAEAVRDGRQRFKVVGLEAVSFEVLADSQPNPAYSSLATACDLGHCDAFLSHSWHDDARAKWKALQAWRANFVAEHGREPKVWLDKCSIDQNRIDVDLRCLPVFLMGCSRLVLFCGPTYLSRLWCILELFTFVHMGGRLEDVDLVLVLREGQEEEDTQTINSSFQSFDAGECQCSCEEEKGRLLAIIQTAFGSMEEFNVAIRAIAKNIQQQCSAEAIV